MRSKETWKHYTSPSSLQLQPFAMKSKYSSSLAVVVFSAIRLQRKSHLCCPEYFLSQPCESCLAPVFDGDGEHASTRVAELRPKSGVAPTLGRYQGPI